MATLKGEKSMTNVPIHGTIETRTMTQKGKDGKETQVERCLMNLQLTQTAETAQPKPELCGHKYVNQQTGEAKYGTTQLGSVSQFNAIKEAAGANCVELTGKDGKPSGKYAVALTADLMPNSAGDGLVPNTAKPMGENKQATAAGFSADPQGFMKNQREIAKSAYEARKQYAAENGLDASKDRDKIPVSFDVTKAMADKAAQAQAEAPEAPKAEAPKAKRTRKAAARKVPDAPAVEAQGPEAESQMGE